MQKPCQEKFEVEWSKQQILLSGEHSSRGPSRQDRWPHPSGGGQAKTHAQTGMPMEHTHKKNNETSFKYWGRRDELYMTSDLPVQIFEHRLKLGWQCDQSRAYQWSPDSVTVSRGQRKCQRKKHSKYNTLRAILLAELPHTVYTFW